ncbi:28S ribosomal protein S29, mitochondrial [Tachyglossus aculeatus]|uniref:28S ribosomal protein S29, mitochondrial n=1 Tax=Tachyglossus aculeatus TaxID=9261 RepID=UPI0018F2A616|nr:28S ribosomal protein S29, mitochondrial [Tachyglossus aculeatus]
MLRPALRLLGRGHERGLGRFLHGGVEAGAGPGAAARPDAPSPPRPPRAVARTGESDPAQHDERHEGRFYSIPLEEVSTVFAHGLPRRFASQVKTLREACVMVRRPALELLRCLKAAELAHPAVRYLLYGEKGTGKTLSLCHAVHFCARQGWLVLHVPDAHRWVKNCRELLPSTFRPHRLDQPLEASTWLRHFQTANEPLLRQIRTRQKYTWNRWESTEPGRALAEVVEQGINRVKSASDVVGAVFKEVKSQSGAGRFRVLVAVDGVNALWGSTTLRREDKSPVRPEELTLVHNLRKMLKNDWHGGVVVTTLSQTGSLFQPRTAYRPHELLGKEGFDALDPFVPIRTSNYSRREFESCLQYFLDSGWLQHEKAPTAEGKEELLFLSNANPGQLERLCASL